MTSNQTPTENLSAEQIARIEHDVQINGKLSPKETLTSEGITVDEARDRARRVNQEWEAARQARKAPQQPKRKAPAAKASSTTTTKVTGDSLTEEAK
jgi:hypothetical protein